MDLRVLGGRGAKGRHQAGYGAAAAKRRFGEFSPENLAAEKSRMLQIPGHQGGGRNVFKSGTL